MQVLLVLCNGCSANVVVCPGSRPGRHDARGHVRATGHFGQCPAMVGGIDRAVHHTRAGVCLVGCRCRERVRAGKPEIPATHRGLLVSACAQFPWTIASRAWCSVIPMAEGLNLDALVIRGWTRSLTSYVQLQTTNAMAIFALLKFSSQLGRST